MTGAPSAAFEEPLDRLLQRARSGEAIEVAVVRRGISRSGFLVLTRSGIRMPGHGEFAWNEIASLSRRTMTNRRGTDLRFEWHVPTLQERIARLDLVTRLVSRLKLPARDRTIITTRLRTPLPQSDVLFALCETLWQEATGGKSLRSSPPNAADDAREDFVAELDRFAKDLRERGATMSAGEIGARQKAIEVKKLRLKWP